MKIDRLLSNLGWFLMAFAFSFFSMKSAYAITVNLPQIPSTTCPAGSITVIGGTCQSPEINDNIEAVVVTAKRLDASGNPVTTAPLETNLNIGASTSGSCVSVPAGWSTTGTGQSCAIVPPSTSPGTPSYKVSNNANTFPTKQELCDYLGQNTFPVSYTNKGCGGFDSGTTVTGTTILNGQMYAQAKNGLGNWTTILYSYQTVLTCSAGYTLSGGNCNLTNAAIVQKPRDGQCAVIKSGSTYSGDTNDPDCSNINAPQAAANKVATTGSKAKQTVTANADGSTTITSTNYNYTTNTTTTTTVNYGSDNKVKSVETTTTDGIAADTDAVSTTAPVNVQVDTANLEAKADATNSKLDTANSKLDQTNANLDQLNNHFEPSPTPPTDGQQEAEQGAGDVASAQADIDGKMAGVQTAADTASGLLDFFKYSGGQCNLAVINFDIGSTHNVIDLTGYCDIIQTAVNWSAWIIVLIFGFRRLDEGVA